MAMRWFTHAGPEMRTERLLLRPPQPQDWRPWAELRQASRDYLVPWEPQWGPDHLTEYAFRQRFLRRREDDSSRTFFLFEGDDGPIVGGITFNNIHYGVAQTASFGYWLGESFAGQGYMTEALRRLVRYGFEDIGLHRLEAFCIPENRRSRNVIERIGFKEEGFLRQYLKINGEWRDHVLYSLLRSDQTV
jgi:ribosomal-protein-alanine N-acetyltransferase